ncbi:MAG: protein translocase subunit SecF [bacterium]|nr:protein translocase subunit SecF [bacterium]MDZ4284260.1 protein translocase subunit SecF [Patescibacteria group bacterium]
MFVIRHKLFFIIFSTTLVVLSLAAAAIFGVRLSIDFTGGTLVEVSYPGGRPSVAEFEERLGVLVLDNFLLQPAGEGGYILRTREIRSDERAALFDALSFGGSREVREERFSAIGPAVGEELKRKSVVALAVVLGMIILFVAWAFRRVSKPVPSWKYGTVAVLTLFHDITIPMGVFVVLGRFAGVEIDILFVTALLAILGYSVSDTIVIFDRIRENLLHNEEYRVREEFAATVGKSLEQTYVRSINLSITTALVLAALLVFGSSALWHFALVLMIGVVAGSYSSIFLASPLLVVLRGRAQEKKT